MRFLIACIVAALVSPYSITHAASPTPPPSLTQYRCYICHADREALTGPAFADIAAANRKQRDAVSRIAHDIRAGVKNGGPWHMPPHPEVSAAEARVMARYIMSLRD